MPVSNNRPRIRPGALGVGRLRSSLWFVAALGWIAAMSGCGGSDLAEVSGTVTHQGKPLPGLFVKFEAGQGQAGWATTDGQGRYELRSAGGAKGIPAGSYRVWVEYRPMEPDPETGEVPQPEGIEEVEAKYGAESSQLHREIDGSQGSVDLVLD